MIFVTGATGFLGSYVTEYLIQSGYSIIASKRASSSIPNKLIPYQHKIKWVDIDLLDFDALTHLLQNVKAVFHCAAMVSFNPKKKKELWRNNVDVTSNLVNVALQFPDLYFMHVSSIAAIGDAKPQQLIDENCRWVFKKNSSDYSITKFEAEREVWRGVHEGLKACIVNPSIILGYDERSKGSMKILELVKKKNPFYTNGIVGYVDVRDVAILMCKLYENNITSERFILNSENRSYKSILDYVAIKLGLKPPYLELGPKTMYCIAVLMKSWSLISGKAPAISLSTAKTAHKKLEYSNQKILKIIAHQFISVEKSLESMLSKDKAF